MRGRIRTMLRSIDQIWAEFDQPELIVTKLGLKWAECDEVCADVYQIHAELGRIRSTLVRVPPTSGWVRPNLAAFGQSGASAPRFCTALTLELELGSGIANRCVRFGVKVGLLTNCYASCWAAEGPACTVGAAPSKTSTSGQLRPNSP